MKRRSLVLALGLALAPALAAAQNTTTGAIEGTVLDESGAVVPGALVEVQNIDTNFTRSSVSAGDGRFVFLLLPSGPYTVTYTLTGFATLVQDGLSLTVGQTLTLRPTLKISAAEEIITVTGSDIVDSGETSQSTTLNQLTVETTPNLGRKFEDLLTLTPGVAIVQGPDGDSITFAGQRGIFNNISLDGGDYNNGFFGEQVGGQRVSVDITLEAIKEFQVVATGANAEYGRTAGGVVNVITKSGTNDVHGGLFFFGRDEALTGDLSDGTRLEGFNQQQFGGTLGGPIKKDKLFFFAAVEGITGDFTRPNLSVPIGTPCPVANPTVPANEDLINGSPDCQRVALLNFLDTNLGVDDGRPIAHPFETVATLLKLDWVLNPSNTLSVSYNFNHSRKENETFDVATYGNSANGIEGDPTRINVLNMNLFTHDLPQQVERVPLHLLPRESRPRTAIGSNLHADTGIGFGPSFRFGDPFFLQPNVDETFWRTHLKNNFTLVKGNHTIKMGGEWIHSLNDQVFRGFFTGRYIFDSPVGLSALRLTGCPRRLRAQHHRLLGRELRHRPGDVRGRSERHRRDRSCSTCRTLGPARRGSPPRGPRRSRTTSSGSSSRTPGPRCRTSPSTSASAGTPSSCPRRWIRSRRPTPRSSASPASPPTARSRTSGTCGSPGWGLPGT